MLRRWSKKRMSRLMLHETSLILPGVPTGLMLRRWSKKGMSSAALLQTGVHCVMRIKAGHDNSDEMLIVLLRCALQTTQRSCLPAMLIALSVTSPAVLSRHIAMGTETPGIAWRRNLCSLLKCESQHPRKQHSANSLFDSIAVHECPQAYRIDPGRRVQPLTPPSDRNHAKKTAQRHGRAFPEATTRSTITTLVC